VRRFRAPSHRHRGGASLADGAVEVAVRDHHPEIGGWALRRWKLPSALDDPVRYHHAYERAPDGVREAAIAYLANRLSHRYGFGCPREDAEVLDDPVCAFLGIDPDWLDATDARAPGLFEVARQILF
jgi:HD-like signal output (HDOD) protein